MDYWKAPSVELSIANYVDYVTLSNSAWGWFALSLLFIVIAQFRPFMAIALMCFYPTVIWAAAWNPFITLYPAYPLILFLFIKYMKQIFKAFFTFRYRIVIVLSALIVIWAFLAPLLYTATYGPPITFTKSPNYHRGLQILATLLLLPAVLRSRDDIQKFISSTAHLLILVHLLLIIASTFFLLSGHALYDLHLMRILETPPVFWESGLLLLCLGYLFVRREMNFSLLIVFGVLACAGLILGNSRTRFLATFLTLLYFMYPYISKRLFSWVMSIMLLMSVSIIMLPHFEDYLSRLIKQRIEQSESKNLSELTSGRSTAYAFAYKRWKSSPFVGVGTCYILPRSTAVNQGPNIKMHRVHNYYLEVIAGQGIIGFGLLIIVIGISVIMVMRVALINANKAVDGRIIVALFFFGLINWMFKESWGITYCTIAILSAYTETRKDTQTELSEN
ncbi:MAG: hypothetical protein C0403_16005 [Desulfobacterium sp.]|nr:hypothetical protein [Desulfobacterium sp.]